MRCWSSEHIWIIYQICCLPTFRTIHLALSPCSPLCFSVGVVKPRKLLRQPSIQSMGIEWHVILQCFDNRTEWFQTVLNWLNFCWLETHNTWQWITWLKGRWRTQQSARNSVNCTTHWTSTIRTHIAAPDLFCSNACLRVHSASIQVTSWHWDLCSTLDLEHVFKVCFVKDGPAAVR